MDNLLVEAGAPVTPSQLKYYMGELNRINRDKALALHLKKVGKVKEAVLVFNGRLKPMQEELKGAEAAEG